METPTASDGADEEHAVIAHFRLARDGFGDAGQREQIDEAEQLCRRTASTSRLWRRGRGIGRTEITDDWRDW
ncbi:hypothetical protein [Streptomyces tauricus]|uniref:hypothetical protein n=1 Tax=Streptomyces tauricus TaxID=68274 RepID=UPI00342C6890